MPCRTLQRYMVHGVIRAPRWFERAVKRINRNLTVRWNDKRQRWVIIERTKSGKFVPVRVLEDMETRAFHGLDRRALRSLHEGDTWRKPRGVQSVLDEIQKEEEKREERHRRERRSDCEVAAHEFMRKAKGLVTIDYGRELVRGH